MRPELELHERIKMRLRLAGSSLAKVARELGVAGTTVTSVSQGYRRSRRIEAAIAMKLGVNAHELWPERYRGEEGNDGPRVPPKDLKPIGGGPPSTMYC